MTTFESRATVGLAPPKSAPRIPGPVESATAHYNGPEVKIPASAPHTRCREFWVSVQHYHMETKGWHDVAYSVAVCQHGIVMAGRGKGVRTAANGTNHGNNVSYAIFFLVGGDEQPTDDAYRAARDAATALGVTPIVPHSKWKATGCPGSPVLQWTRDGAPTPVKPVPPKHEPEPEYETDLAALLEIKTILGITVGRVMDPADRQRIVAGVRRLKG